MEPKAGSTTSEFKFARLIALAGLILTVAGAAIGALKEGGIEHPWLAIAMVVVGVGLKGLALVGYTKSRTELKVEAMQPAASEVVKVTVPFVKALSAMVKEELTNPAPTSPESPKV